MLGTRFDRVEQLRTQLMSDSDAAQLADVAMGDAAAVQVAWASFVPFLAHPAMADPTRSHMGVLDAAAEAVVNRRPVAA